VEPISRFVEDVGNMLILLGKAVASLFRRPFRITEIIRQMDFVGVQSVLLIVLTGAFTGMVMCLQSYNGLRRYGAVSLVGATVALSLARELGPVISALMVTGRVGSAMTAELGSMRSTQQIDALHSMAVDPVQYLALPRILAATLVLPVLAGIFSLSGMLAAYVVAHVHLGLDEAAFRSGIEQYLSAEDITHGLMKAVVFGLTISLVACYKGFSATGGARGIGISTTQSVVISSVLVLVLDYVMTAIMYRPS
jgi:phospholipid/cholesterol/gamma-HCH transport system permease protein